MAISLHHYRRRLAPQRGMALLEVLVGAVVLMVGMIGVLSLFGYAVATMTSSDEQMIARQKAREAMECIVGARNSASYSWADINNAPTGKFVSGATTMTQPGADGLINTGDDGGVETITLPNGKTRTLSDFTRQITIAPAILGGLPSSTLRTVTVTITYPNGRSGTSTYQLIGYISSWN
jgi:Tfp pilus assembly protein PilW